MIPAGLTAAALGLAGCAVPEAVPPPPAPVVDDAMPVVQDEVVHSEHRGTDVRLMTYRPSGADPAERLPMVLYLHGRDGVEPTPIPFDTLAALERGHRDGVLPPFGLVSVDGGYNPYWNDGSANGDLSSMLTDELPGWLRERGLGDEEGRPFAVAGISTGGFGALNYAIGREQAGQPLAAVAELAPALPANWEHMREKGVFSTEEDWHDADPLRHLDLLGNVPVGVWIGDVDPFLEGAMRLAEDYSNTPVVTVLPGGHDPSVFDAVGAEMVGFLADNLPALD
ncbi:alpha/beta hydrolase [Saccharopolyspora taberi]|uniref:alpha/beta hydrolase n=1 Tax=Saccharopolyspora taberi TaxID=60895 RepID=UPI0031DF8F70